MDKKTVGIIATAATALLCGCPGLFGLCFGAVMALVGVVPGAEIDMWGSNDPGAAIATGMVMLCLGLIFVAIPVVVGIVTLRPQTKPVVVTSSNFDEPLPPAI